ncbi:MAG: hypothetical protein R3E73_04240 [Porticoccaceae bacterium]
MTDLKWTLGWSSISPAVGVRLTIGDIHYVEENTGPRQAGKNGIWTIDKRIRGYGRLFESTGTGDRQEAERYLTFRLEQIRNEMVYGVKPDYTFRQAATKYLLENERKRSIDRDASVAEDSDSFIGNLALRQVHQDTLGPFIASRKKEGLKSNTINRDLAVVRRVLILAARLWRDERGNPWLETTPLIRMLDWKDARKPYPISWVEQERLFAELPIHLREMALFKVNTGTREAEVCGLRWSGKFHFQSCLPVYF